MIRSINYKYLFVFILAFYGLVLTQFGFENFDTGYIPSFSWRILNGQMVYQDFIYKGPPVTLYFHAFFMKILPEERQFFFIRILSYLLFSLQVFLIVTGFDRLYDFATIKLDKWGIICLGFIISILNFSPYPWPTTDGLLFAAIAFWMVSKYKNPSFFPLLIIAFFTVLSALTKQSFYLVPLFFLFWIFMAYNLKKAILFLLQIVLWVVLYFCIILSITDFKNFIHQTTRETHLYNLFYSGFHNYIFISVFWFVALFLLLLFGGFVYLKATQRKIEVFLPVLKWLAVSLFAVALGFCLFKQIQLASRIAFDASLIAVVYGLGFHIKNLRTTAPILVILGIAWSSSISQGYQYPILFATGIMLSFFVLIGKELNIQPKYYFWIALPIVFVAFSYNIKPYREPNIFSLKYSLESISPKLKYIKTNKSAFKKYSELKMLVEKYGENFIVAPNIPMANYIFNNQSKLPADWIIETEVDGQQKRFIKLASDPKNYIFLEKSFLQHEEFMTDKLEDFSSISVFIYKKFNLIDQTNYFLVYNSLKKNEKLP